MPELQQAQQLQEFANEVFELSKQTWAAQTQAKAKGQPEISETEFLSLDILAKADRPLNVGEIQRVIGVLPAQMSRILRSLERKGGKALIECQLNADDKRKIDVTLTAAGHDAHQTYRQIKLGSIQKMLLSLDEKDRLELMRILRAIRNVMFKASSDNGLGAQEAFLEK